MSGNQRWNKKPEVDVFVYQYDGSFYLGNSGAPICYTGNNNVVGVFTAKDDNYGWVIPIQEILKKFDEYKGKVAEPLSDVETLLYYRIIEGNRLFGRDDYDNAIVLYDKALNDPDALNDPNYVKALYNKALALRKLKKYDDSIKYYDKALSIDPNNVEAMNGKGVCFYKLGEYTKAIECYDKALSIDPNRVSILNNRMESVKKLSGREIDTTSQK